MIHQVSRISLKDWIPPPFDGAGQNRIALAGDAAGPVRIRVSNPAVASAKEAQMTMYRGEGVNHGILDAALLAEGLLHVKQGRTSLPAMVRTAHAV